MKRFGFKYSDGGRDEAGFKGDAGDCGLRSICIALELDYAATRKEFMALKGGSVFKGVYKKEMDEFLGEKGWSWEATCSPRIKTRTKLNADDLPSTGTYILRVSRHFTCLRDGIILDNHNPDRDGNRMVYGYWHKDNS